MPAISVQLLNRPIITPPISTAVSSRPCQRVVFLFCNLMVEIQIKRPKNTSVSSWPHSRWGSVHPKHIYCWSEAVEADEFPDEYQGRSSNHFCTKYHHSAHNFVETGQQERRPAHYTFYTLREKSWRAKRFIPKSVFLLSLKTYFWEKMFLLCKNNKNIFFESLFFPRISFSKYQYVFY